ncbi:hypothetical protein GE09DRAFT_1290113 [Coniochaeta sp. 2T2.1]|nr:hypothetical protein GE09DRAFT_1290113 [Coniochaeta sp. 2T2.1]
MLNGDEEVSAVIAVESMRHQAQVLRPEDDWTGVVSSSKRWRLQNRLNQKTYRKRKLRQTANEEHGSARIVVHHKQSPVERLDSSDTTESESPRRALPRPQLASAETRIKLGTFAQQAYRDYVLSSPRPSALQTLIQFNVINALTSNAETLNLPVDNMCDDSLISPFNSGVPSPSWAAYPPSLRPTAVQLAVLHHPWIDLFPMLRMRDNLIRACGTGIDEDELNIDLIDVQESEEAKANMIVWGNPADPLAWEATVPFLRKWGWLLKGCSEVLEATNYWRERRGERRLVFEVS